jgi:hypothetical protein
MAIGVMFVFSLARWGYQLVRLFTARPTPPLLRPGSPAEEIDPAKLDLWVHSQSADEDISHSPEV